MALNPLNELSPLMLDNPRSREPATSSCSVVHPTRPAIAPSESPMLIPTFIDRFICPGRLVMSSTANAVSLPTYLHGRKKRFPGRSRRARADRCRATTTVVRRATDSVWGNRTTGGLTPRLGRPYGAPFTPTSRDVTGPTKLGFAQAS